MTINSSSSSASRRGLTALFVLILLVTGLTLGSPPVAAMEAPPAQVSTSIEITEEPAELIYKRGDKISIFSGEIHIPESVSQHGQITSIGGDVLVEGEVDNIVAVFGNVTITGKVHGSVITVLSTVDLEGAEIRHDMINVLGGMENISSIIHGENFNLSFGDWVPNLWRVFSWIVFLVLLMNFVLLVLLAALAPNRIRTIGAVSAERYVAAFFMGLLGYLILLVVLTLLSVTVVGLPIAMLGFWIAKWLGIAGIFFAVGQRLGKTFGREFSVLGSLLIAYAFYFVFGAVPLAFGPVGLIPLGFFATLFFLLFEIPGVGLIMLTGFGGRSRSSIQAVVAPVAPAQSPPPPQDPPSSESPEISPEDPEPPTIP